MAKLSVNLNLVFDDESFADRIERAAAAGADAVGVFGKEPAELRALVDVATDHGLTFAYASSLVGPINEPQNVETRVSEIEDAVALADELGIECLNVTPGQDLEGVSDSTQFAATVETLRRGAPAAADADVTLVMEPLNTAVDHPGRWLVESGRAFEIVTAVDHPNVGVLFDVYHQQVTEGNVTERLTENVDAVGHVHVADVPGRHEPGTGELAYERLLPALLEAGYDGYVGCEFTPVGDPEAAVARVGEMLEL
ncbi:TIM barrel protein [Natronoglomus mannanivorans]|uniref:TIM barrel protein n=1 Tax=Natronoglomus mannanivorans TaxID=2979990 RepID=A0AAP3E2U4_9EURY|nr:TIM barrel protein [Halobacteria archaeon AArc-xg1-1]